MASGNSSSTGGGVYLGTAAHLNFVTIDTCAATQGAGIRIETGGAEGRGVSKRAGAVRPFVVMDVVARAKELIDAGRDVEPEGIEDPAERRRHDALTDIGPGAQDR